MKKAFGGVNHMKERNLLHMGFAHSHAFEVCLHSRDLISIISGSVADVRYSHSKNN